jgi:putative Mg2+ transporter-C (MgtC) family protein
MVAGRGAFCLHVGRGTCIVEGVPADPGVVSTSMAASDWLDPALRLGAAALAGGVIGWERQFMGRPAGLRTHMLVSVGSAIAVSIFGGVSTDATSHVVQGVATGVGFLCAGDILHQVRGGDEKITGLTSAAALWVTSALGMAAATGRWALTTLGTVATLLTLTLVRRLERHLPTEPGAGAGAPKD